MQIYKNKSGHSNVSMYEIKSDSILVVFRDGSRETYDYNNTIFHHVEHMKDLATSGEGLDSYIHTYVYNLDIE